jgi:hypothetical protein
MSDTLGVLCRRVRASRTRRGRVEWAWISVEPKSFSRGPRQFLGIALIDGRRRGPLFNGVPASFPVEQGEHTVAVSFSPCRWKRTEAGTDPPSLAVAIKPGEHAWLLCRERPQWRLLFALFRRAHLALMAVSILVGGSVWLVLPSLRELIATVTLQLGFAQPWLSGANLDAGWRLMTALLAGEACGIIGMSVFLARHRRLHRIYREQFGEPWLMTEEPEFAEAPVGLPIPRE